MKTRYHLGSFALLAGCAALTAALAGPKTPRRTSEGGLARYGVTVYSDLCVHADSGEFGGQRITLQRFTEVDTVIYEFTAGGLSWPLVASDVNIDPRGTMMYFTVQPADDDERTISGKFSPDGDTLTLEGGYCEDQSVPMVLTKVTDFGRKPKSCKACPAPSKMPKPRPIPRWEEAPPSRA